MSYAIIKDYENYLNLIRLLLEPFLSVGFLCSSQERKNISKESYIR